MDLIDSIKQARCNVSRMTKDKIDQFVALFEKQPKRLYVNGESQALCSYCLTLKKELKEKL